MSDLIGERVLLRIYLRTGDRAPLAPTFQRIVRAARAEGLAGATVLKGILGYGAHGESRGSRPLALLEHVPIIVEIVDCAGRIDAFARGTLAKILAHGLATIERANVIVHRPHQPQASRELQGAPMNPSPDNPSADGVLLRVFLGEADRDENGRPLYESIVRKARELGLAGATVLRGVEGFGANSVIHKAALLEMSTDLPIVIEIVDREAKVQLALPQLDQMVKEGMITMERVAIVSYRHNPADAPRA
jgi:hypothetical protein